MWLRLSVDGKNVKPSRQSWPIDFMYDALVCGSRFRTFNLVDEFNREVLLTEIDLNIPPAQRVARVPDRVVANRGYPPQLCMDNGPERVPLILAQWAEDPGVMSEFIKPGKPAQHAFIEHFNRTYRTEILDFHLFSTLNEVGISRSAECTNITANVRMNL